MPQLDLVTFPSQVFWLTIFFMSFYAFVSGHFVPLLHKIIRVRSKKTETQESAGENAHSGVLAGSEVLVVKTLDKSVSGLSACSQELGLAQNVSLSLGDKSKLFSLANTVASVQGRYLVSRGLLKLLTIFLIFRPNF